MSRAFEELLAALYDTVDAAEAVEAAEREEASQVSEFVVMERDTRQLQSYVTRSTAHAAPVQGWRESHESHIDLALYRDLGNGRGSTRIRIPGQQVLGPDQSWQELIDSAIARAGAALEPAWSLPMPAAPARVQVADPALVRDPEQAMTDIRQELEQTVAEAVSRAGKTPPLANMFSRQLRIAVRHDHTRLHTSHDFVYAYRETLVSVELALALEGAPFVERSSQTVRRRMDLDVPELVRRGVTRIADRKNARPTPPGRYDVVLVDEARTPEQVFSPTAGGREPLGEHGSGNDNVRFGWLAPLVAHADSGWARRGLTRYRPGQSIHGSRQPTGDPLTVISDSTLPYGLLSRPVGDLGEPTRRFTLIDKGVAAGLSATLREAALRGVPANGGVGNLQVLPGPVSARVLMQPADRAVLRVVRLDWMEVDTRSGTFVAEIGLGYLVPFHKAKEPKTGSPADTDTSVVTGGMIRGNVFDLWAQARLSSEVSASGWYHGPSAIRFNGVQVS